MPNALMAIKTVTHIDAMQTSTEERRETQGLKAVR